MRKLRHLSFEALMELVSSRFEEADDGREADQVKDPWHDVLMSGLARMYIAVSPFSPV